MDNIRSLVESDKNVEEVLLNISEASASPSLFRSKLINLCREFDKGGLSVESMSHTMKNLSENLKTYMY